MNVVGYARVSQESETSINSQLYKIKEYCGQSGLSLVGCFFDNGKSGKNLSRRGLFAALQEMENNKIEGIVVSSIDRLTRNVSNFKTLLDRHLYNKRLISATPFENGNEIESVKLAQWERETMSRKTKDALVAAKARGGKTGGYVPYGHNHVDGKLIENQKEQEVISLMKKLREEGNSYRAIVEELNSNEIKTKNGKDWSITLVKRICDRRC